MRKMLEPAKPDGLELACKSGQLRGSEVRQNGGHAPLDGGLCQPGAGGGPQLGGVPLDGAQLGGVSLLGDD